MGRRLSKTVDFAQVRISRTPALATEGRDIRKNASQNKPWLLQLRDEF